MASQSDVKQAIVELNKENSDAAKNAFYDIVLTSELWIAFTDLPAAMTPDAIELDGFAPFQVLSAMGPDGSPVLLAFSDEASIGERIQGMDYHAFPAKDILTFVQNGAFGGLIVNPHGPWAGIPVADIRKHKLAEAA